MTVDQLPVLDPAALFRRLARGPDDCRRCAAHELEPGRRYHRRPDLPSVRPLLDVPGPGRGHRRGPGPASLAHRPNTGRSTPTAATTDPFAIDPWTP
jgi:hypothetical protein